MVSKLLVVISFSKTSNFEKSNLDLLSPNYNLLGDMALSALSTPKIC